MNFQNVIWEYYTHHGRKLPWRETSNPYHIVVSEIMLQQTQVSRVSTKYQEFITKFPSFSSLTEAPFSEVLLAWSGLGYNRRAKYLHSIAQKITTEFAGEVPKDPAILETFPGIGHATARSIIVFSFNLPLAFIETNIRRVFLDFFFPAQEKVDDKEIMPLVEKHLDIVNPRAWYWALMDYGTFLATGENANKRSRHYTKQSQFVGSTRQMRGEILRVLLEKKKISKKALFNLLNNDSRIEDALAGLLSDKLVHSSGDFITIST
jgi:A/G-specific adenine glycosylase